ncbi:MAG: septum site-determining protein MinC [Anaerolineales bacterium]|nr:septum site-determining protein MinC [Anaerolineales bacterium]
MPNDDMSELPVNSNRTNGNSDRAWQNRMADLLDDVTVNGAAAAAADEDIPPFLKAAPPAAAISSGLPDSQPSPENDSTSFTPPATESTPGADYSALFVPVEQPPPPAEPAPEPPYLQPPQPAVSIKGRTDGLAIEIGKGTWQEVMALLVERLEQSASFFRNAKVALDVGPRPVVENELRQLITLLGQYGMVLSVVRTSSERTFQAALGMGLTTTLESADGAPVADATPADVSSGTAGYFIYRGYLRSGHRLQRKEHILVIGDVNPGAEVVSSGDVLVWGRLRGIAHAGFDGNRRSIIAALDLEATQLRIADIVTIGPDPKLGQPGKWFWKRNAHKRPEVARILNESIIVDEWDVARPGGLASLRRGGA